VTKKTLWGTHPTGSPPKPSRTNRYRGTASSLRWTCSPVRMPPPPPRDIPAIIGGGSVERLPIPNGRFFGRSTELSTIENLVRSQRFLSIVGAPGVGKTRLALEYAIRRRDTGARVLFCDLTEASSEADVTARLTRGAGTTDLDQLLHTFADESNVLVLDT